MYALFLKSSTYSKALYILGQIGRIVTLDPNAWRTPETRAAISEWRQYAVELVKSFEENPLLFMDSEDPSFQDELEACQLKTFAALSPALYLTMKVNELPS